MIRTSVVLSPRQNSDERLYLQANGLPVEVSGTSQAAVTTSHRPVQLYQASRYAQNRSAANLTSQTGIQGWQMQRIMELLDRQGSDAVTNLYTDGELDCEWLVAVDENRINAILSESFQFYLFRDQDLLEMKPVAVLKTPGDADGNHFRLEIRQEDQILILPRGLIPESQQNEAETILNGMQQLPDRLSKLIIQMRSCGVKAPANGWLALHALNVSPKYIPTDRSGFAAASGRRKPNIAPNDPGYSVPLINTEKTAAGSRAAAAAINNNRLIKIIAAAVLGIILLSAAVLVLRPGSDTQVPTGSTGPTSTATSAAPTTRRTTAASTLTTTTKPRLPNYVIARRLNLRSEAGTTGKLIRTLTVGDVLYVLARENDDWVKVETAEGEEGFVYAAYISDDKPSDQ